MKKVLYALAVSSLVALAAPTANAALVLFDDFDGNGIGVGDGTSVNGGFQLVSNPSSQGTGTVGETPSASNANIVTDDNFNGYDNSGIVSINSFDASAATSISATWVVASQSPFGDGGGEALNTQFLLQGGTGFRALNYIQFTILSDGTWDLKGDDGAVESLGSGTALSGVADGYTLTLDLDAAGWEITTTGLDATNISTSGAWAVGFDFTALQTDLHVAAMVQKDNEAASVFSNIDSISVTVVPEPGTYALLAGLLALSSVMVRRRSA